MSIKSLFVKPSRSLAVAPRGKVLSGEQAEEVIEKWQGQVDEIKVEHGRIKNALPEMFDRKKSLENKIKTVSSELSEAKKKFLEVKTPVAKEKYARKLVLSNNLLSYLRDSLSLIKLNTQRAEASIEDALMIGRLLEEKITDAKLYYELNGQVRLIGNALAAAENVYDRTKSAEKDLEISMEGLEELTVKISGSDLLLKAEEIIGKNGNKLQ